MGKVNLPYNLRDGQTAYAARLMADLNVLADKLNFVRIPGLTPGDMENALIQLKMLIDEEAAADKKVVSSFFYDEMSRQLCLELRNGAVFKVDIADFVRYYSGSSGDGISISVDGEGRITAQLEPGSVGADKLDDGLQKVLDGKLEAEKSGNAAQVLFSDGQSMQDKLDNGELRGSDAVNAAVSGMFYLRVDEGNGHLYIGVADGAAQPPLSINNDGHLIYTIE